MFAGLSPSILLYNSAFECTYHIPSAADVLYTCTTSSHSTGKQIDYNVWGNQNMLRRDRERGMILHHTEKHQKPHPGDTRGKRLCNSSYTVSSTTITPGMLRCLPTTIHLHSLPQESDPDEAALSVVVGGILGRKSAVHLSLWCNSNEVIMH